MSNYLAIATVTACLKQLLQPAADIIGGATVTTTRPDLMTNSGTQSPGVNIFMYQVQPNAAWRNEDLPARRSNGTLITRPRVAIDLYYMISFHGNESELEPQRLLGSVARAMHEKPVLTPSLISETVDNTSYLNSPVRSNLENEIELVKFTPTALSTEEISKLWAAFQTPYVLTAVYHGTVVLIDSDTSPTPALPVRSRNIYVSPLSQPILTSVTSQEGTISPIDAASTLVIKGQSLIGDPTMPSKIRLFGSDYTPTQISGTQLSFDLTSLPGTTARAGVQSVQVVQPRLIGTPAVEHTGVESNVLPFILHPTIVSITPGTFTGSSPNLSGTVTLELGPTIGMTQRMLLILNEASDTDPVYYNFVVPDRVADDTTIDVTVTGVKAGTYFVRVMIDGAQSILDDDTPQLTVA